MRKNVILDVFLLYARAKNLEKKINYRLNETVHYGLYNEYNE